MYPKSYSFILPGRFGLCIVALIPLVISSNRYFIQGEISLNELVVTSTISTVLFCFAYYFARVYPLEITADYFETKKRKYHPNEIKVLIYSRSGHMSIKLMSTIESRKLKFKRSSLPDAVEDMIKWAKRNNVEYKIEK